MIRLVRHHLVPVLVVVGSILAEAPAAARNPESVRLRARAFDLAYNLDRSEAYAVLQEALAADTDDVNVYRAMAAITWLDILFQRGAVSVDDYVGHLKKSDMAMKPPPPDLAARFKQNAQRAMDLAERQLTANPRSAEAHYNLGAAVAVQTSYMATVEGRVMSGLQAARRAYSEHTRVLELDPRRKDANLIAGTYRYVVAQLPWLVRLLAYAIGFDGGKEQGLRMIEESAGYPSDVQVDSKLLLILLYNREKRYADALRMIDELQQLYPRNRLLWLEAGATEIRAGKPAEAEALLNEGLSRLDRDTRPRAFGEEALWRYKRGLARRMLGRNAESESDLRAAVATEGREWVHGRAHLELGRLADLAGDLTQARREYEQAVTLCDKDDDVDAADESRRLLNKVVERTTRK